MQRATAINPIVLVSTEDQTLTVDFTRLLKTGELLDSAQTPTVTVTLGDNALAIGTASVNTSNVTDDFGNTIAPGYCVQFEISGGTPGQGPDGTPYMLRVTAQLTNGKKRAGLCPIYVPG